MWMAACVDVAHYMPPLLCLHGHSGDHLSGPSSVLRPRSCSASWPRACSPRCRPCGSRWRQVRRLFQGPWLYKWPAEVSSSLVFRPATGSKPGRVLGLVDLHLLLHCSLQRRQRGLDAARACAAAWPPRRRTPQVCAVGCSRCLVLCHVCDRQLRLCCPDPLPPLCPAPAALEAELAARPTQAAVEELRQQVGGSRRVGVEEFCGLPTSCQPPTANASSDTNSQLHPRSWAAAHPASGQRLCSRG